MAVVVPLFMWSDLVRVKHYVDKKWDIRYRRVRIEFILPFPFGDGLMKNWLDQQDMSQVS